MRSIRWMCALAMAAGATGVAQAQFVDSCAEATSPVGEGAYSYDLFSATNDGAGTCGGTGTAPDQWILFVPNVTTTAVAETCGLAGHDTVLEAWSACGGTVLACLDDFCGLQSHIEFPVSAGTPVLVRIAGFAGGVGSGSVRLSYLGGSIDAVGFASPDPSSQGDTLTFTVDVTPAVIPPSTDIHVTADLSLIGGASSQPLYDDSTHGDTTSGDNQWNVTFTTAADVTPGFYSLPFTVTDGEGRNFSDFISFTILPPPPSNDDCANALTVSEGNTSFDSSSAITDGSTSCIFTTSADIWFRFVPTSTGIANFSLCGTSFDTVLTVIDGDCGGAELGCNDDSCGLQSTLGNIPITAGHALTIRVARFGNATGGPGTLNIAVPTPPQWDETANGGGDAGDLPATAQTPTGTDPFGGLTGIINDNDADMYLINICQPASFSASVVGGASYDTQLFLFDANGMGIAFDDDSAGTLQSTLTSAFTASLPAGNYYLAISPYSKDALDEAGSELWLDTPFPTERAPDGLGAANPIASWNNDNFNTGGSYNLTFTGVCFASGGTGCDPDLNQDGNADQDDVRYLVNVVAGGENTSGIDPDFNHDGNVDQDDVRALVNVVAGGDCP